MRQALVPALRAPQRRRYADTKTFTAPVRGLVTNANLSNAPREAALVLDNWFPTQTGIRLRGGTQKHATLGAACTSLFSYRTAAVQKLFGATASAVFDITAPADVDTAPAADISGLNGGNWSTVQFETTGGEFLIAVNGADNPREFDGSSWSTATLSGTGLTVANLSQVWAFKERLFFVEDGTQNFWYLPVGVKQGTLTRFGLGGVFEKGGSLLYGASWSLDAGDGVDDLCVFVSTLGEVAVYQGTDPNTASTWSLVGRYDIDIPLGKNSHINIGGDLFMATKGGIVPINEVLRKAPEQISLSAVTRNIEPSWQAAVAANSGQPWTLAVYVERNMLVVGVPAVDAAFETASFIRNTETGGWCRFTGAPWDIRGQTVLAGVHYVGDGSGTISRTEETGSDNGSLYTSRFMGHFDHFRAPANTKVLNMARASFRGTRAFNPQVSCAVNYMQTFPAAPSSIPDATEDNWDEGLWDSAVWDGSSQLFVTSQWQAIACQGFVAAPIVQVTSGVTPRPDAELMAVDIQYERGSVVN